LIYQTPKFCFRLRKSTIKSKKPFQFQQMPYWTTNSRKLHNKSWRWMNSGSVQLATNDKAQTAQTHLFANLVLHLSRWYTTRIYSTSLSRPQSTNCKSCKLGDILSLICSFKLKSSKVRIKFGSTFLFSGLISGSVSYLTKIMDHTCSNFLLTLALEFCHLSKFRMKTCLIKRANR